MLADFAAAAAATVAIVGAAQHDAEPDGDAVAHDREEAAERARRRLAHRAVVRQQAELAAEDTIDLPQPTAVAEPNSTVVLGNVSGVELSVVPRGELQSCAQGVALADTNDLALPPTLHMPSEQTEQRDGERTTRGGEGAQVRGSIESGEPEQRRRRLRLGGGSAPKKGCQERMRADGPPPPEELLAPDAGVELPPSRPEGHSAAVAVAATVATAAALQFWRRDMLGVDPRTCTAQVAPSSTLASSCSAPCKQLFVGRRRRNLRGAGSNEGRATPNAVRGGRGGSRRRPSAMERRRARPSVREPARRRGAVGPKCDLRAHGFRILPSVAMSRLSSHRDGRLADAM